MEAETVGEVFNVTNRKKTGAKINRFLVLPQSSPEFSTGNSGRKESGHFQSLKQSTQPEPANFSIQEEPKDLCPEINADYRTSG